MQIQTDDVDAVDYGIHVCIKPFAMKKVFSVILIAVLAVFLCACSQKSMEQMTTKDGDDYAAIVWGDRTYVPYGALSAYGERGKQIGIVDGDKNYRAYECKGYASEEWIVTAFPHDPAMLLREINVADVPAGWQSEYAWNQ